MDSGERQRLKQLANDSIIATFGYDTNEARLAQALESSVEEFEFIATGCDHCKFCDVHGEVEDDEIPVDAAEIMGADKLRRFAHLEALEIEERVERGMDDTTESQWWEW